MVQTIEAFTKRKIVDIKDSEDTIDQEYLNRIIRVKCKSDLVAIIDDYEDFLPSGFASFREYSEEQVSDLMDKLKMFFNEVFRRQAYSGPPNISILMLQPIMIVYPRMWAIQMTAERSKKNGSYRMTWGQAWKELYGTGAIQKMMQQQERMFQQLIDLEKEASDVSLYSEGKKGLVQN